MELNVLILLFLHLHVLVQCVTFDTPPQGGDTIVIREDAAPGSNIYPLQATDPSGNLPIFEIVSSNQQNFKIDPNSDYLTVPSEGLDAEKLQEFVFKLRVTAGSATAESGRLTVRVIDVNDNVPVFKEKSYAGEVWKNDPTGTRIVTVKAMDPDISKLTISYSIAGAQTTFSVDSSGVITLADPAGLTFLSSPIILQAQAFDGGQMGTADINITLKDDPCSSSPCSNGGRCESKRQHFSCACLSGYSGALCESVDYCYASPCKNGATCTSNSNGYTCDCAPLYFSPNCTCVLTVPKKPITKQVEENSPNYTEIHTFQNVYTCSASYEANVVIRLSPPRTHFRMDGMRLLASGLDAESQRVYNLTFRFTAGQATADSGFLTVRVTDVNDNDPVFQEKSYTGEIWKNDPAGTRIVAVSATDPDISKLTTNYSIVGTQTAFSVDNSGMITLVDPAGLTFLSSLTALQVQASDGKRTGTTVVTITIHDDPCSTSPCKNGGTCDSTRQNVRCTCLGGYTGNFCESVPDFCAASPCKNGATCTSHSTGYMCDCPGKHFSPNCTCVLRVPRYIFPKQVAENSPDDTEIHTFHNVYRCSTSYEANVDIRLTSPSNNFRMDGRRLLASGLDAERQKVYRLRFRVTAGTATADIGPLTVLVTDVNDNNPVFQRTSYTGEIWKNDHTGKSIVTVNATDSDVSKKTITYSIVGPQTAFSVDNSGSITLVDPDGLTSLSSPIVLQVQASDGRRTGNTFVTITIHDDPCSSSPCHNGGSCTSYKQNFSCYCIGGYHGKLCELDFCSSSPCKNGGTCTSHGTGTTCKCTPLHLAPDCRCVVTVPRTFTTKEVTENSPNDTEIYTFQNVYNCSTSYEAYVNIRLTTPSSNFRMDGLRLLASGLDAESQKFYRLNFRVTVGTVTVDSGPLEVQVTDVNDNNPEFQWPSYAGEVWKNDPAGTRIVTVKATDRDVSKSPIRYSMNGAQTTFSVDNSSGVITLADPAGLTSLSSMTELQVQASDGGRTGTSSVTITIHDDPCSRSPCRNGGTCDSNRQYFNCTCLGGYSGTFCESEAASISDYCYASPCKNGATCTSNSTGYTCDCAPLYFSPNCACVLTVPRNRITIRVEENFPDDTEMYTFRNVYSCSTSYEANVNIRLTSPSTHFRMDRMRLLASGLDAERQRVHRLNFRVTAGSASANTGPLRIRVTDVNDIPPVYNKSSYTGNIRRNDSTGTRIVRVKAKDHDISNLPITYTIVGAQTTFSVDNSSGVITLADPAGLTSLSSHTTVLQVQASDGGRTATVSVNITIHGTDFCKPGICQHGGTCIDGVASHTCMCVPYYVGDNCETNLIAKAYSTLVGCHDHSEISKTINVTCYREHKCMELRKNRNRFTSAEACCTGEVGGFTVQTSEIQGRNAPTCIPCAEWRRNCLSIPRQ